MNKQSNRMTQFPLFVIQVDVLRFVGRDGNWDVRERKDSDYWNANDLCESCLALYRQDEELPSDCSDCNDDTFAHYEKADEFSLDAGVFLTEKACEEHIASNLYHYNNPRSYAISAYRNPEMQFVLNLLSSTGSENGEAKSYYK